MPEGRFYIQADLVTLALTVDVRLIPKAEVGRPMIGDADSIANDVR